MLVRSCVWPRCIRRGAVTAWLLITLPVIIGIVAIGMDGGRLLDRRRQAQATADAAALAAATSWAQSYFALNGNAWGTRMNSATSAARSQAAANGFNNDGTTSTVTVNIPPASGAFAGQANYLEVIVSANVPKSFSAIFNKNPLSVSARAVAVGRPLPLGIILLQQTGANGFLNNGQGNFTVVSGQIFVNSNDAAAFNQNGAGTVSADAYDVTGNYKNSGGSIQGSMRTGTRRAADPLLRLAAIDSSAFSVQSNAPLTITSSQPTTLQPGVYRGGIKIQQSAHVKLSSGVYILEGGGLEVSDQARLSGSSVLFYNTSGSYAAGPITINSQGKIKVSAATSGLYQGISIFQDRSNTQSLSLTGNGNTDFEGTVYAPLAAVNLTANGGGNGKADIVGGAYVCKSMVISGTGNINVDLNGNGPLLPEIALVE
jgi:Putative Flp pilus-assembly TadE/G-like